MRLLLIEDDLDTSDFLKQRLEEKCFAVDRAITYSQAATLIKAHTYDIVLVDYGLPDQNGTAIVQTIRDFSDPVKRTTPILMISVTHELITKLEAFNYGADDYIQKPFVFAELFARIQAVLRRPSLHHYRPIIVGNLVIDLTKQQVLRGDTPLNLTKKEFSLLEYLVKNEGSVLSRRAITEHVWDMNIDPFSNTIDTHITNLRKKLESTNDPRIIQNIPGRGYTIDLQRNPPVTYPTP